MRPVLLALVLTLLPACLVPAGRRIGPDGPLPEVQWTEEERARDLAVRSVREAPGLRVVLVHLNTAEQPHDHPDEDLTVFVLEGACRIHVEDRSYRAGPGDVIEIPAGVRHWAENTASRPSLAYAVFTARR